MKIKIPKGEYCDGCNQISLNTPDRCCLFEELLFGGKMKNGDWDLLKCHKCLNHEPVIVEYEGEKDDENKNA